MVAAKGIIDIRAGAAWLREGCTTLCLRFNSRYTRNVTCVHVSRVPLIHTSHISAVAGIGRAESERKGAKIDVPSQPENESPPLRAANLTPILSAPRDRRYRSRFYQLGHRCLLPPVSSPPPAASLALSSSDLWTYSPRARVIFVGLASPLGGSPSFPTFVHTPEEARRVVCLF